MIMAVLSTANTALKPSSSEDGGWTMGRVVVAVEMSVSDIVVDTDDDTDTDDDVDATLSLTMVIIFCMIRGNKPPNTI